MKHRPVVLLAALTVVAFGIHARSQQPKFTVCKSTYALCTTAKCTHISDNEKEVSCACEVKTGYSLGAQPCDVQQGKEPQELKSRYYPIKSYARCSNDRPWAYCLDATCAVDSNDRSKAFCTCKVVRNQGDYVITVDRYDKSTCTSGIISSATVEQLDQATDFLETQDALLPSDFKVLNVQHK